MIQNEFACNKQSCSSFFDVLINGKQEMQLMALEISHGSN